MLNQGVEKISYRVAMIKGGITHPILGALPDQGSLPVPSLGTGTVSTDNGDLYLGKLVTGTGTSFLNDPTAPGPGKVHGDIEPGDYIAGDAQGKILRRITKIWNDGTHLEIEAKFPVALSAVGVYIVKKHPYRLIAVKCVGAAAVLQEQTMQLNEVFLNGGSPIYYDCSATGAALDIQMNY